MVKIFGSFIIILSGFIGGKLMGYQYVQRTRELQQFYNALHMLETEIGYGQTLLPLAVERLAQISNQPHKQFFLQYHYSLQAFEGLTADQAWQAVIIKNRDNFCLKDEDWEVLTQYGQGIGNSDDQNQIRHLKVAQKRLEQLVAKSKEIDEKMSRLWNYVGILTSIALVILLY